MNFIKEVRGYKLESGECECEDCREIVEDIDALMEHQKICPRKYL